MVKKLGHSYKTGGFKKIATKAAKKYGSKKIGERVAGKIFWNKVNRRKNRIKNNKNRRLDGSGKGIGNYGTIRQPKNCK